jgi:D-glycero-D-manno-heptose 1,7-bisphosphate phosphatase
MKLIILDRDGVINEDSDEYIKSAEEFVPIPGSLEAIARLNHAGYTVVIATNQSGIARGYFGMEDFNHMHDKLKRMLSAFGGHIDALFFCPHGPDDHCRCRKPLPGLFEQIAQRLEVSLEDVPCVGDSRRDVEVARSVQAQPILVRTGKGERTVASGEGIEHIPVYDNLAAYVDTLLNEED